MDTFYEGQGRVDTSFNKKPLRDLMAVEEDYRNLNILNFEMESGTLFKMANVYGLAAACVCAVIAQRVQTEEIDYTRKITAEENAIRVALEAIKSFEPEYRQPKYWR